MAQTVAVVRNTLPFLAVGNTVDFTKSGFGTPTAAIFIVCQANTTNNPQDSAVMSVGFWDGTNQVVAGFASLDNQATTDSMKGMRSTRAVLVEGTLVSEYTASSITDGVRLTLSVDNTGVARYCTVIMFAGVSAKAGAMQMAALQNNTANSPSLGFAPQLIFMVSHGESAIASGSNAFFSFGFADDTPTHRSITFFAEDGVAAESANLLYSETRSVGQVGYGAATWGCEVTTFGADTFTVTTRDGSSGSDYMGYLALGGADLSYDMGTLTSPTSTGNSVVSTAITPAAVLLMLSTATSTTIETGAGANGMAIGLADANGAAPLPIQAAAAGDLTGDGVDDVLLTGLRPGGGSSLYLLSSDPREEAQ